MLIFKKEARARKLMLEHLSVVHDCLEQSRAALEDYVSGEKEALAEQARQVKALERQADTLKHEARNALNEGAFLPQIRSDIYRMVETVDEIAGSADATAKFLVNQTPLIPPGYETELLSIHDLSVDCFSELRRALKDLYKPKGRIETLHEHSVRVHELETEVDEKQAALTRRVFDSDLELAAKMHFCELLRLIAGISDQAQHVADELASVVMRSVV